MTTLQDLIKAQQHVAEWQFLPAIVSLQSAHSKLVNWNFIVPLGNHVGLALFSRLGHRSEAYVSYTYPMTRGVLICNQRCPIALQGDRVSRALHQSRQTSPPPPSSLPRLYKWICSFYTYLMAKVIELIRTLMYLMAKVIETPMGPKKVSILVRCPNIRG